MSMYNTPGICLNGFTNRISHERKSESIVVYRCNKRVKTKKCSKDRVDLGLKSGKYCKMCYRKQDASLSAPARRRKSKTSRLGCVQCKETICKSCWEEGYDMHLKK